MQYVRKTKVLGETMSNHIEKTYNQTTDFYQSAGAKIGKTVDEKQIAYGDSFHRSGRVLEVLYPYGIKPNDYENLLYIVRVIDKLFRLATNNDKFGESPARDIAGYSILKSKGE
jgi:hypothetical protein